MKKVIFLLLLPLIAEVVVSCCNCVTPQSFRYSNKSVSATHLDNSGDRPQVSQSDNITKTAYGIRISLEREQLACNQQRFSLFISSAYAFSCRCEPATSYIGKDSIRTIRIISNNAFDNTHPAGSDVSTYFRVFDNFTMSPILDYVKNWSPTVFNASDLKPEKDILLLTPPTLGPEHSFRIEVLLTDGRTLETTTSTIKLL